MKSGYFSIVIFIFLLNNHIFLNNVSANDQEQQLFESYDVKFYHIDIEADNQTTNISGSTKILVQLLKYNVEELGLELTSQADIDSIIVNRVKADFTSNEDTIVVSLPETIDSLGLCELQVFYKLEDIIAQSGRAISNREGYGGHFVTWTLSESFWSKYWMPCKQELIDKADSAYIYITTHDSLMAGSNGILTNVVSLPGNKKRYEWKTKYPIAYYLISFTVGNFLDYSFYASTADGDSVLVQNYIYNDSAYFQENKSKIDATGDLITLFSQKFGSYPFKKEKYGHCTAPMGGGMEHQTMTTLNNFNFDLVAHELAHQWFGDNVTCSDWQNIWINEGFASYGELVANEYLGEENDLEQWVSWAFSTAMLSEEGSLYVPDSEKYNEKRIFDHSLSYKKGAVLIHMMRYYIDNDELFFEVLKEFQSRFEYSTASAEDFKNIIEEKTGIDFDIFYKQWFYGEGYPNLDINWEQINDSVHIYVSQNVTAPGATPFFSFPIDFKFEYFNGDSVISVLLSQPSQTFLIPFKIRVNNIITDPDRKVMMKINGAHRIMPNDKHACFSIFPNPAANEVYIHNLAKGKPFQIRIFDLKGLLRYETFGQDYFTRINIESFESGMYQVVINSENFQETYPIVKS